jgi:hypothetical protein
VVSAGFPDDKSGEVIRVRCRVSHPVKMLGVKGLAESCEKGGLKCGQSKWKDEVDLDDDGQPISASNGWELLHHGHTN